eukprot:PhM_4_TR15181/c0_g1_i1/m.41445
MSQVTVHHSHRDDANDGAGDGGRVNHEASHPPAVNVTLGEHTSHGMSCAPCATTTTSATDDAALRRSSLSSMECSLTSMGHDDDDAVNDGAASIPNIKNNTHVQHQARRRHRRRASAVPYAIDGNVIAEESNVLKAVAATASVTPEESPIIGAVPLFPLNAVAARLAQMIGNLCAQNPPAAVPHPFDAAPGSAVPMTPADYVVRLGRYLVGDDGGEADNDAVWVTAALLLDRWIRATRRSVHCGNAHRAVLSCLCVALKLTYDRPHRVVSVAQCARVGGIGVGEMCVLERCLLTDVRWDVYVCRADFDGYLCGLLQQSN